MLLTQLNQATAIPSPLYPCGGSLVPTLLTIRCPTAIPRLVVSVNIIPFYRMRKTRAATHVSQKQPE
jgi:hypothetical protein